MCIVALAGCAPGRLPTDAPEGALVYEQIDCAGSMGEAGLLVGPDGTVVLWDVGNDGHADAVREALRRRTGAERADVTVISHFHADHGGALDRLVEAGVDLGTVVVRDAAPGDGATADVVDALAGLDPTALCAGGSCELPRRYALGEDATLALVAANGQALDRPFPGVIPDDDDGENARSIVGIVTWGTFTLLLPGDLTGGGKDTPDVESHVAATLDAPTDADVVVLGHHGIDSSTSAAWIDRWLPDDGEPRTALVGANAAYLDAPADEVLDRLRGRVSAVWTTRGGSLAGSDPLLVEAGGAVTIVAAPDGAYAVDPALSSTSNDRARVAPRMRP